MLHTLEDKCQALSGKWMRYEALDVDKIAVQRYVEIRHSLHCRPALIRAEEDMLYG
jgi:hypothetical protein